MAFLDMPVGRSVFLVGDSGRIEEVSSSVPPRQAVGPFMAQEHSAPQPTNGASEEAQFMAEFERQFNEAAAEGAPAIAEFHHGRHATRRTGTRKPTTTTTSRRRRKRRD